MRSARSVMNHPMFPLALLALVVACSGAPGPTAPAPPPPSPPPPTAPEVFVGAGDIGWCGLPGAAQTATLLDGISGTVFTTGDNAYPNGSSEDFRRCYDPQWGRHRSRTFPVPGNHDYDDGRSDGSGYFGYFGPSAEGPPGANAGPLRSGYYSYSLGAWHVVALNSEISAFPGSSQEVWLRDDLTKNRSFCTLAYFHTPVFGSGSNGSNPHMQVVWQRLYEFGVDVVVNGHNHSYERFAPQDPGGSADLVRGIREFVVGTGGALLTDFPRIRANSEVRIANTWGVLKLTLWSDRYDWQFVAVAGQSLSDSGSASCH